MNVGRLGPEYTRLYRHAGGGVWLASDHLLAVVSAGFTERYLRVALRDVKAVFLVSGDRRIIWGFAIAIVSFFSGLVALMNLLSPYRGPPRISAILFALSVVGLVWNQLLGPGGGAYLVTDVQTLRLPGLGRRRRARRAVDRLAAVIRETRLPPAPPAS